MDKKTPNKRKSLANAKETPNKIRKTTTPVSQKLNNKSPKSTNTKQKTPQTQTINKTITPKGKKLTKQIEEDETDDESDELNGTNDNDAVNSDNEVDASSDEDAENGEADSDEQADSDEETENGEADSGEELDNVEAASDEAENVESDSDGEADSDEEADSSEEAASDDEAEIDETNSDEKVLERNKRNSISVYVKGLNPSLKIEDVFKDCNIFKFRIYRNPATNRLNGRAFVTFTDKESLTKALKLDGTRHEDQVLSVKPYIDSENRQQIVLKIYVKNLSENTKVEDVFKDCKIQHSKVLNGLPSRTVVYFEDEESLQKALLQHDTEHDGRVITVFKPYSSVFVQLNENSKLEDVFKDCNIQEIDLLEDRRIKKYNGHAIVHLKDKESLEKALAKHNTEIDGTTIRVELYGVKPKPRYTRDSGFKPPGKYGNSGQFKPSPRDSYNPGSKIAFLKKQLLLEELKLETQKLEREIYKQSKPFNHRKQHQT